ncbi:MULTISPECIES: DUF6612 family protein [unclassified Sporosarcina]|uniref:DUF6612 family protein n=1 Tax=unclassified Sporosarcina TaxID=2647733 RepID=UPI000C16EC60|nr:MULTISPECIES: DUF6612 family protein [unclassified Sporosarcina]PID06148.1 hypothetical protein CSV66_06505 [Sporosarcina sp. P30]PID09342.1 hypothetical protein CSV65_06505 [Sporosarcina sp. P31]PID12641.1 hypothetical protein CSV64_05970 [Sporosarcina sp. P32b]
MKKWTTILTVGTLAFVLSACGQTAEPKEDPMTGKKEEVVVKSELTAGEVMEKASAAAETQQSMHSDMDIMQTLEMGDEKKEMNSTIEMDMILEPLAIRQTMNMQANGEEIAIEQYMTQEGFFMKNPESGSWIKLPNEMYKEVTGQTAGMTESPVDFTMYEEYAEDFTFEETDDEYVLTLIGSGEKFSELMKEMLDQNMPAEADEAKLDNVDMKIEKIDLQFTIDKKTFFTKDFDMDMIMAMEEQGQQVKVTQNVKGTMTKINEIDEIKVPKEILDSAKEMD